MNLLQQYRLRGGWEAALQERSCGSLWGGRLLRKAQQHALLAAMVNSILDYIERLITRRKVIITLY